MGKKKKILPQTFIHKDETRVTAASKSRDVCNSKDPSNNRNASFKQGTQARESTTLTAKTPATAGSVWKSYKSNRSQKYGCKCGNEKKMTAVKGPRVAFLFFAVGVAVQACKDLATLHSCVYCEHPHLHHSAKIGREAPSELPLTVLQA